MNTKTTLLAGMLLTAHLLSCRADHAVVRTALLMGTMATVEVRGSDSAKVEAASELVLRSLEASEARLSTWREESELSRVNRTPVGSPHALSALTAKDLRDARMWCERTKEAFDPAIGRLVRAWGIRDGGRTPGTREITAAMETGGLASWSIEEHKVVRVRDVLFEEGGFGKGAALREAFDRVVLENSINEVWINLGGQVARTGRHNAREVLIAHPFKRDEAVISLSVESGSIATSGNSESEHPRGHIIDPRTGSMASKWGSVSVWHPDALAADALSTALYVMGPEAAIKWAEANPPVRVAALEVRDGKLVLHASEAWRENLRILPGAVLSRIDSI